MSGSLRMATDLARSPGVSVRRCPHDPGVPIDYVLLAGDAEPGGPDTGHDAGFEAGYAKGQEVALAEAAAEARRGGARLDQALGALGEASRAATLALADRRNELEQSVTAFAFELVETLVGRELALADHPGRDAVARALAVDQGSLPATVRLHPDDAAALNHMGADALTGTRELTFVVDEAVEPGGALVDIGGATIDSQLSSALQRVRDILIDPSSEHRGGSTP